MRELEFDLERAKETFMEAKRSFTDAPTSRRNGRLELEMDPSMLTMFLEACIKLIRDSNFVKDLQEVITICAGTTLGEPRVVWKIKKHTMQIGKEMRLTA